MRPEHNVGTYQIPIGKCDLHNNVNAYKKITEIKDNEHFNDIQKIMEIEDKE